MEINKSQTAKTVVAFTGDFSFSSILQKQYLEEEPIDKEIVDYLNSADAAIFNYESPITDYRDVRSKKTGRPKIFCHRTDREALEFIRSTFCVPVLSFANNHMNDMGDIGIIDTLENADKYGIRHIGSGRDEDESFGYVIIGNEIKVGIFAVEYKDFGRNPDKPFMGPALESMLTRVRSTIEKIKQEADYTVIVHHGGEEFLRCPDPHKRNLDKRYIEMGCDAVVAHHPHIVQGYEYVNGKPAFYSLGNFYFDTYYQRSQKGTENGLILKLIFSSEGIEFDAKPVELDRDTKILHPGEMQKEFSEMTESSYSELWKEEKKHREQIEKDKEQNKDDVMGAYYIEENVRSETAIELMKINNRQEYFDGMIAHLEERKENIDEAKKKDGIGDKEDEYYLSYLLGRPNGHSVSEEAEKMDAVCSRTGISPRAYFKHKLFDMPESMALKEAETISKVSGEALLIADRIAKATGSSLADAFEKMDKMCRLTGIGQDIYYKKHLYEMSLNEIAIWIKKDRKMRGRQEAIYGRLREASGHTTSELREDRKSKGLNLYDYYHYGLWKVGKEDCEAAAAEVANIHRITEKIRHATYATAEISGETANDITLLRSKMKAMLSEERKKELAGYLPENIPGTDLEELTLDMHFMMLVWGYTFREYLMFDFRGKTIEERLKFVSTSLKNDVLDELNPEEQCTLLNDKHLTFLRLRKLYGRDVMLYDGTNTEELIAFIEGKGAYVEKPLFGAMGRGVKLVELPAESGSCREETIKMIEAEYDANGAFLAEDLIKAHEKISKLNPDSVNTVRICTYNDNGNVAVHDSFAKVGRAGSFVDNGGSGGIIIHIDERTGCMDSDGIDENGCRYESHPDNGTVFRGYVFPDWESALNTAKEAAKKMPELGYIGWDLTYTEDNEWIIVEGNARTQFLGQQATTGIGTLDSFAKILGGYDRLRSFEKREKQQDQ